VNHLWGHLKPKADARYANAVAGTDKAKDADKLDGKDSSSFGTALYFNQQLTDAEVCGTTGGVWGQCAPISIVVPAGHTFLVHATASGVISEFGQADTLYLTCISARLEPSTDANCGGTEQGAALPNNTQESISANRRLELTEGTWVVSHGIWSNNALDFDAGHDWGRTQMTLSVTDAATGSPVPAGLVKVLKTAGPSNRG
jgi:hypothetical protein